MNGSSHYWFKTMLNIKIKIDPNRGSVKSDEFRKNSIFSLGIRYLELSFTKLILVKPQNFYVLIPLNKKATISGTRGSSIYFETLCLEAILHVKINGSSNVDRSVNKKVHFF